MKKNDSSDIYPDTAGDALLTTVNLKELSRRIGLSMVTVSRALNNRPGVKPDTRRRVLEAAREHGYSPSPSARQLRARPSMVAELVFAPYYSPSREINPYALNFVERLRAALKTRGVDMKVYYYQNDEDLRMRKLEADVWIFYGHFKESSFAVAHECGVPALLFDKCSTFPDQVSVLVDAGQSCNQAVQYLAALGHERIGLMTGPTEELYYSKYANAFLAAMKEFNLKTHKDWIFCQTERSCNQEGARETLLPLLKNTKPEERPTAMVFASDWLAFGGRRAALDAGLSLPDDFSIVGHDNLPAAADIDPSLTTFDVYTGRVVQTLKHLAVSLGSRKGRLQTTPKPGIPNQVMIPADFIKRNSCVCLRPAPEA